MPNDDIVNYMYSTGPEVSSCLVRTSARLSQLLSHSTRKTSKFLVRQGASPNEDHFRGEMRTV